MEKEIYIEGQNFLLMQTRKSQQGRKGRCIIESSGYTATQEAMRKPWIFTQLETVPHLNRSNLPDPFMAMPTWSILPVYKELDCNVFNLYFLPGCKGIEEMAEEIAEYAETHIFKEYERHAWIGHSKGGLLFGEISKFLKTCTNIAMITPTFGTIMGDEQMVFERLDAYRNNQHSNIQKLLVTPEVSLYKNIMHVITSRRPIDYDMALGSTFLGKQLDLSKLVHHRTLLITAECPTMQDSDIGERFFIRYGKFLGLDVAADGMVTLENQRLAKPYVKEVSHIYATHPTALAKSTRILSRFLADM